MRGGKIFGFQIIINDYFLLLLLGYALLGVLGETLVLFCLVLCHEMAHLFVAHRAGIKAREVELFPFGGVARLDGLLELSPWVEIKVALAGPTSNFLFYGLGMFLWPGLLEMPLGKLFLEANLMLGLFNLLPALPLDGGRIMRAFLAKKMGFYQATNLVLKGSKLLALGVGLWGLLGLYLGLSNLHTLFMAVFLYGAAVKEEENFSYLFLRYLLRKGEEIKAWGVLPLKQFITTKGVTLGEIVRRFGPGYYHLVLVLEQGGNEFTSLTEHQIVAALLEYGRTYPIGRLVS